MSRAATTSALQAPTFTAQNGDPEQQRGSFLASRPGSFLASVEVRDGRVDRATRRMPMSLVVDPAPDLHIMQEEIFGPVLGTLGKSR